MFQFITTFAVWLLAERLEVSAILTMVAFALFIGRYAPSGLPPRQRIIAGGVWDVAVHVLTVLAFILTGLQLKTVLSRLDGHLAFYLGFAGAVCAVAILVRMAWVVGWTAGVIAKNRRFGAARRPDAVAGPNLRSAVFIGWSGMRGVVTLATALALPNGFPHRDLLMFTAFAVVLTTLVLQGFTVAPLLRLLRVEDDGAVQREIALARAEIARAALACMLSEQAGQQPPSAATRCDATTRTGCTATRRPGTATMTRWPPRDSQPCGIAFSRRSGRPWRRCAIAIGSAMPPTARWRRISTGRRSS